MAMCCGRIFLLIKQVHAHLRLFQRRWQYHIWLSWFSYVLVRSLVSSIPLTSSAPRDWKKNSFTSVQWLLSPVWNLLLSCSAHILNFTSKEIQNIIRKQFTFLCWPLLLKELKASENQQLILMESFFFIFFIVIGTIIMLKWKKKKKEDGKENSLAMCLYPVGSRVESRSLPDIYLFIYYYYYYYFVFFCFYGEILFPCYTRGPAFFDLWWFSLSLLARLHTRFLYNKNKRENLKIPTLMPINPDDCWISVLLFCFFFSSCFPVGIERRAQERGPFSFSFVCVVCVLWLYDGGHWLLLLLLQHSGYISISLSGRRSALLASPDLHMYI